MHGNCLLRRAAAGRPGERALCGQQHGQEREQEQTQEFHEQFRRQRRGRVSFYYPAAGLTLTRVSLLRQSLADGLPLAVPTELSVETAGGPPNEEAPAPAPAARPVALP